MVNLLGTLGVLFILVCWLLITLAFVLVLLAAFGGSRWFR